MKKYLLTLVIFGLCACKTIPNNNVSSQIRPKPQYTSSVDKMALPYRSLDTSKTISKFGFGSCNDQNQEQPLWKVIPQFQPDLFIMMGDNIYASWAETKPLYKQYVKLNENADYRLLRESTPFLATWDDHDYGQNDGGISNPDKQEARTAFLNYWGYLKQTLPLNQQALYHSRIIGDKKRRVQFIMLDTRWDRSDLIKNPDYKPEEIVPPGSFPKIYLPNEDKKARLLSDEQWTWLDKELEKSAELRILISSIQLIPNDHYFEKWGNFPLEKDRFFKLLQKRNVKNLVILSGDRHTASIASTELKIGKDKNHKIYEITGSGLNKPSRSKEPEKDATYVFPSFLDINFGLATIDWDHRHVKFEIIDQNSKTQLSQEVGF